MERLPSPYIALAHIAAAFPTRIERFTASIAIASAIVGFGFILWDAAKIAGGM